MIGNTQGKIWGSTRRLFNSDSVQVDRAVIKKGRQCSVHLHEHRNNMFYLESGKLLVRVWKNDYDLVDETVLGPGDFTYVAPRERHQFVSLEDSVVYEIYWVFLDPQDIVRESCGGKVPDRCEQATE